MARKRPAQRRCHPRILASQLARTLGVGPTKLFREFIERFAPAVDSSDDLARKRLYAVRSMVTHGNSLFYADESVDVGWHSPTPMHEYRRLMDGAKRVCRRAVIGWLQSRDK